MNSLLIQALAGLGGILVGAATVCSVYFVQYYFDADNRWYRKNARDWKRWEAAQRKAAK